VLGPAGRVGALSDWRSRDACDWRWGAGLLCELCSGGCGWLAADATDYSTQCCLQEEEEKKNKKKKKK